MLRGLFITDMIDFIYTPLPCRSKTEQSFISDGSQPPDAMLREDVHSGMHEESITRCFEDIT